MTNQLSPLQGKRIILGVSGGISCYKSADLVRKLIEMEADVRVVMTAGAQEFVTPLTFQALSGNPVHTTLLDPSAEAAMGHIELARWADVIVIAPASANTLARLAHGMADDLLATLCLATEAPLAIAPAMNRVMWSNPATQANLATLQSRNVHVFGPGSGDQACGEVGAGRMLEPLEIRDALSTMLSTTGSSGIDSSISGKSDVLPLDGVHLLLTAGPTQEQIDPVRFLSNNSSGKMGFALATIAQQFGAQVTLVAGPVHLPTPAGVIRKDVISASDMLETVLANVAQCDIFIAVAAVADYRVADVAPHKLKKSHPEMSLELTRTEDILATVAGLPSPPFCVGFAAETKDMAHYAQSKLEKKKLHMIAANPVVQEGKIVFGADTNSLEIFWPDGGHATIESAPKQEIAKQLLTLISSRYKTTINEHH